MGSKSTFQVERVTPINHSSSQKIRLNDLSYGTKTWTDLSSFFSQCTRLTDRRTDRILIARPRLHSMQRGKNKEKKRKESLWVKLKAYPTNVGLPNN